MESLGNDNVSSPNARMESLGNDDLSPTSARKYLVGNDDVKAENTRRRYGYCDVAMTVGVCHTSNDFKRFVSRFWLLRCSQSLFETFTFTLLVFSDIRSSH